MLVKAYAKLNQNYDRLWWGMGVEPLRALTGMPTDFLKHNRFRKDHLWRIYSHFAKMNYPSSCGSKYSDKRRANSIVSNHLFSFLDLAELKDKHGKVVHRIAKMRNPWSHEQYSGPFRDNDPIWNEHPEWKKQVDFKVADDGIFWMPFDDFYRDFSFCAVAFY